MAVNKTVGRPRRNEKKREELHFIGFKVDAETLEAIEALEAALPGAGSRRRSQAIRKAILEARGRL